MRGFRCGAAMSLLLTCAFNCQPAVFATFAFCGHGAHTAPIGPLESSPVQIGRQSAQGGPSDRSELQIRGNPLWAISLRSLAATRDRPIFLPSRRPPMIAPPAVVVEAVPPAPPAEPERLQLTLLGTVGGSDSGIAVAIDSNNVTVRLRTGEQFDGWTLLSVHGREATFKSATQETVLRLPSPENTQTALPPQELVPAGVPPASASVPPRSGGTWRDGDGNLITPPKMP